MAGEVFVDTSGFYPLLVKGDDRHARLREALTKDAHFHQAGFVALLK